MLENHNYWYFKNAIPETICDEIINQALKNQKKLGLVDNFDETKLSKKNVKKKFLKIRNSDVIWLENNWISHMITGFVNTANVNSGWNYDILFNEYAQFTIYNKNQHYDWHQDITKANKDFPNTQRKLSVSVQLSNPSDYEGGELLFNVIGNKNKRNILKEENAKTKGSVIVFPSYELHKVTPVTKGIRYSLVMWFRGPKFK